jgi:hypothetical protein
VGEIICEDDYDNVGGLETDQITLARAVAKRGFTRSFEVEVSSAVIEH